MILPTSVMRIRIIEGGRKRIGLWLPVFLVWPIAIALMIALAPVAIIVSLVCRKHSKLILSGPRLIALLWAMRGLEVRVKDDEDQVLISFA